MGCQCPSRERRAAAAQQVALARTFAMAIRTRTTLSAAVARALLHLERDEPERLLPCLSQCICWLCIEFCFVQSLVCAKHRVWRVCPKQRCSEFSLHRLLPPLAVQR